MAGTLKIGGNTIATHAGSEGAGTVTLDSSTLTIGSNVSLTSATFPAGMVVNMVIGRESEQNSLPTSSQAWVNYFEMAYTYKATSSKTWVVWHVSNCYTENTGGFGVRIYKKTSSGVANTDYLIDDGNMYTGGGSSSYTMHSTDHEYNPRTTYNIDTQSHTAGDTVYYAAFYRNYTGQTVQVPRLDQASDTSGSQITGPWHGLQITEVII